MAITVRYFASLKQDMGRDEDRLDAARVATVADVWRGVAGGKPLSANTLSAVNMEYAGLDQPVEDGDEVAFFPPVTGGGR